jgi:ribosomal protein S12 methylthiotransferase
MHYVYPYPHVDGVLPLMAEGKVLPYLDIPFQHASPTVLKRMKRPAHAEDTLARLQAWRRDVPDLAIRSSFIVGFPGETDDEFEQLLDWLEAAELDRIGCFKYSPVEGATANALGAPVPAAVVEERHEAVMALAQDLSEARLARKLGQTLDVLVDRVEGDVAEARTAGDAPEIDGLVHVKGAKGLKAGEFARVTITGAGTYDLEAKPAN